MIGKTLSHFRIISEIGEGGMSVVHRAEDERSRRATALWALRPVDRRRTGLGIRLSGTQGTKLVEIEAKSPPGQSGDPSFEPSRVRTLIYG